jgi:hypothetical protein
MRPATKARLKAIAELESRSEWRVVEDSIALYFDQMSPKARRAVDTVLKRAAAKR